MYTKYNPATEHQLNKARALSEKLELLKDHIYKTALEHAYKIGIPHVFVSQAVAMTAASMCVSIHTSGAPDVARTQAINSFGGAVKTMIMNGMDLPEYGTMSETSVDIYIGPSKLDS